MKQRKVIDSKQNSLKDHSDDECYDSYLEDSTDLVTSTPIRSKERRAVSLLDISEIGLPLDRSKITRSSDTIGSSSSLCKDSGYNHSESSLVSEKEKDEVPFGVELRSKYVRLIEDMKYKDVMITALHDSNHSLRMRIAEAENKIAELRLKCESHCKCCTKHNAQESTGTSNRSEKKAEPLKYSVTPIIRSEESLIVPPPNVNNRTFISTVKPEEPKSLSHNDSFMKVAEWQNSYRQCEKRVLSQIPASVSTPFDARRIQVRSAPQPLPLNLSYMETAKALVDGYRRPPNKAEEQFRVQMIGDQTSVCVRPVTVGGSQPRPLSQISSDRLLPHNSFQPSNWEGNEDQRQHDYLKLQTPPSMLRIINVDNQESFGLFECLKKANEYARDLSFGLSKLPNSLEHIRSFSNQLK